MEAASYVLRRFNKQESEEVCDIALQEAAILTCYGFGLCFIRSNMLKLCKNIKMGRLVLCFVLVLNGSNGLIWGMLYHVKMGDLKDVT